MLLSLTWHVQLMLLQMCITYCDAGFTPLWRLCSGSRTRGPPLMSLCGATFTDDAELWSRGYTQLIRSVAAVAHYDQMHKPGKVSPCKHRRCWFAA